MVNYEFLKYIKARMRDNCAWTFSHADLSEAAAAPRISTCIRCFARIAKLGPHCEKPDDRRCDHCVKGYRSGCTEDAYSAAVTGAHFTLLSHFSNPTSTTLQHHVYDPTTRAIYEEARSVIANVERMEDMARDMVQSGINITNHSNNLSIRQDAGDRDPQDNAGHEQEAAAGARAARQDPEVLRHGARLAKSDIVGNEPELYHRILPAAATGKHHSDHSCRCRTG
ncbi:hypothetical protein LTR50_002124 [Elasticomyces elasticus]|nr:hypothetical protein LTR50_002124 [Elasticomyces elasticus]